MVKFLSDQWIDYSKQYILDKLDPKTDLKNMTTSLLNVVEHVPPDDISMNFYMKFQDGKLTNFDVNTGDSSEERDAVFVIRGNYGTFKDILKGEMTMTVALLKNRLKLKGSKMKALRLIKPLDGVIASLREVTDEYEE